MAVLIICFTCIVIVFAVQWIFRDRHIYAFGQNLPGPKALVILGNILSFAFKNDNQRFNLLVKWHFKYQDHCIWRLWFGPSLWIFVNKPEAVEILLKSTQCVKKIIFNNFIKLENPQVSEKQTLWKNNRESLKSSICDTTGKSIFIESIVKIVDALSSKLELSETDILEFTQKYSLLVLCNTIFGIDLNYSSVDNKFVESVKEFAEIISARRKNPVFYPEPLYRLTRMYYREKKSRKVIKFYLNQILHEKRQSYKKNSSTELATTSFAHNLDEELGENTNLFSKNNCTSLLDELVKSDKKLFDHDIYNQVMMAITSGYETIAIQSAYVMLMLAMHPTIQTKLMDEINDHISDQTTIDCDILDRLIYMNNVINETLRLFPVVPFTCRKLLDDLILGELTIPKGVTVFVSFYSLHRRLDVWGENANKFDPDNFLPENTRSKHSCSFLPFSVGDNGCLGNEYSILSMKIMLIKLITNYKFSTVLSFDDISFNVDVVLRMLTKNLVKIERRSSNI